MACAAARKLGTCVQRRSFRRAELEDAVLDRLRTRLMQPDAVAKFVRAFSAERTHSAATRQRPAAGRRPSGRASSASSAYMTRLPMTCARRA